MTVHQSVNPENLGSQVSPRIAPDPHPVATADSSNSNHDAQLVRGESAPPSIKSVCKHCHRPITRDLEYELHLPAEGQRWYHDDFVDGTEDGHCDGVSCKNETADRDATIAEPRIGCSIGGRPLNERPFPDSFYRPRFLVLPTGRSIFAWGIWDSHKNPLGSIPSSIFKMSDFVHRTRSLGKAYAFARRLNEKHERRAA